jgi:hypothetical protein
LPRFGLIGFLGDPDLDLAGFFGVTGFALV